MGPAVIQWSGTRGVKFQDLLTLGRNRLRTVTFEKDIGKMATVYRNRQLMYLSVILFFYFASIGCLSPFLTSHMRHLGFSLSEISFINAVSAFFSIIGPLLGGTFAEIYAKSCHINHQRFSAF
ncbi:MFS_1_like domain-containing protein [Trichonephila inaurata madagascariensis]|uniref:MFS_1_like domain-containing protein n=1 Tax=Trichonephila inaurata madagascariensis TaxID=2747483 RepID=A0A8X6WXZ6_9ARAC|nr:MFS_1_like domain-containing protein [Trichonephila inaurata madagascariensis]